MNDRTFKLEVAKCSCSFIQCQSFAGIERCLHENDREAKTSCVRGKNWNCCCYFVLIVVTLHVTFFACFVFNVNPSLESNVFCAKMTEKLKRHMWGKKLKLLLSFCFDCSYFACYLLCMFATISNVVVWCCSFCVNISQILESKQDFLI